MSAEVSPKMRKFLELARVLRVAHEHTYAPAMEAAEALSDIRDFTTMLESNFADGDSEQARIENTAGLLAHTLALADLLIENLSLEQLDTMIEENTESEVAE